MTLAHSRDALMSSAEAILGPMVPGELPELLELQRLARLAGVHAELRSLAEAVVGDRRFPVQACVLGSASPDAPAVGFFGGVHGLERIGAEVVMAYLRSLVMRLRWDDTLHRQLESLRVVFMPLVNPGGMWRGTRANPNGVDLMRNAAVDACEPVPYLVCGQRISASLPWYRGPRDAPMECESAALCRIVEAEMLGRPFSIAVDCHSGFGLNDRIWFPYAHTKRPIEHLPELHALCELLDDTLVHHRYLIEPQSRQYLAHGDLWDQLYLRACEQGKTVFLPLTLEMGSWLWVKKNPRQVFSRHGIFNPVIAHRQQRVLRTHIGWLDFVMRAAGSHRRWLPAGAQRIEHRERALARWYDGQAA